MRTVFALSLLVVVGSVGSACSSSDKSAAATSDAAVTSGGGGTGLLPDGGCAKPGMVAYGDHCLEPAAATSQCQADSLKNSPGSKVDDTTCGAGCTCTYCATQMQACGTDPDCIKILLCAQEHNCTGATCYIAPAGQAKGPCQDIIDASGMGQGIQSYAVALVQEVNACATKVSTGHGDYANREGPMCPAACL